MANYENNAKLHTFRFPKGGTNLKGVVADIFDIDADFGANEEYFREDTTSMGYETESQRCADEVVEMHKDKDGVEQIEAIIREVIGYSNGMQTFIVGNPNHSGDYDFQIINTNDEYIVAIAYVGS